MKLSDLIDIVALISNLEPSSHSDKQIDEYLLQYKLVSQDGAPSRAQLLGEIEKVGIDKIFKDISLDDRKNFLANISSAYRAFPDIQKIVQTAEQTTTANVAAYPVPIGRKPLKKYESVKESSVGPYVVGDGVIDNIEDALNDT